MPGTGSAGADSSSRTAGSGRVNNTTRSMRRDGPPGLRPSAPDAGGLSALAFLPTTTHTTASQHHHLTTRTRRTARRGSKRCATEAIVAGRGRRVAGAHRRADNADTTSQKPDRENAVRKTTDRVPSNPYPTFPNILRLDALQQGHLTARRFRRALLLVSDGWILAWTRAGLLTPSVSDRS